MFKQKNQQGITPDQYTPVFVQISKESHQTSTLQCLFTNRQLERGGRENTYYHFITLKGFLLGYPCLT